MSGKISYALTCVEIPLLSIGLKNAPKNARMLLTIASPSHPALKYPFSSCESESADTGPLWPFIT